MRPGWTFGIVSLLLLAATPCFAQRSAAALAENAASWLHFTPVPTAGLALTRQSTPAQNMSPQNPLFNVLFYPTQTYTLEIGTEPSTLDIGTEPSTLHSGVESSTLSMGIEPSNLSVSTQPSNLDFATQPSSLQVGTEPSMPTWWELEPGEQPRPEIP